MKKWGLFCVFASSFLIVQNVAFAAPIAPGAFSTTWNTGDSTGVTINLDDCPTSVYWESLADEDINGTSFSCDGIYDMTIDFGDGGEYRVDFVGFYAFDMDLGIQGNRDKFRSVEQWGDGQWLTMEGAFENVTDLTFNASDTPDLSLATNLEGLFRGATNFNSPIDNWDVSHITSMGQTSEGCDGGVFQDAVSFNQPLDNWDVSNVTNMDCMFNGATAFNQPLNSWNVSSVTDMSQMFYNATSFNQPLNSWVVSSVTEVQRMFFNATSFNQSLSNWSLAGVTRFDRMFEGALAFNQSLADWAFDDGDTFVDLFKDSGITSFNYSALLERMGSLNLIPDTISNREDIGLVPSPYCDTAEAARDTLIANGWLVADEGIISCFTLSYTAGTNASLIGSGSQTIESGGDATTVEVVPDDGYRFIKWSDESTTNPRTDTAVTGNISVTAILEVETSGTQTGSKRKQPETPPTTITSISSAQLDILAAKLQDLLVYIQDNQSSITALSPEEKQRFATLLQSIVAFLLVLVGQLQ